MYRVAVPPTLRRPLISIKKTPRPIRTSSDKPRESDFPYRPLTLAFGTSRDARIWYNETRGSEGEFLSWLETPDANHHEKDGFAFLQGTLKPGETQRQAKNMDTMHCIAFDVESGERPETIAENAKNAGVEVVIYPTFNHDKPETRIKTDAVHRWAKIGAHDEATAEQVLAYLRKKKGYLPCIMDTAQFVGRHEHEYVVSHAPLPRFRVVAMLRDPVKLADLAPTLAGAKETWKTGYYALGAMLGIQHFDESCDDLSRLFYPHRRPKNAAPWSIRVQGKRWTLWRCWLSARAQVSVLLIIGRGRRARIDEKGDVQIPHARPREVHLAVRQIPPGRRSVAGVR